LLESIFEINILNPLLEALEKHKNKNAFCISEKFYTYYEFSKHISKIRIALKSFVINNTNIGIVANDDLETYASIFAIWLEGYAYVPLHPLQPVERNLEIVSQAGIDLIIDSSDYKLFPSVRTIESSRTEFNEILLEPKKVPDDAIAYILFTSGSTGKPKGVPIMRGNIGSFMKSFLDVGFKINHDDRFLQCFDLTFDVSVQSFLVPIINGACIYTIPHDQIKYIYVYSLFVDYKLTFITITPSMLRYLRPYFNELNIRSIRYCIITAEASQVSLIKEWSNCIPNAEIYNFYGPTEATIYCTYYRFNKNGINKHINGILSIGKGLCGVKTIIVDENKNILEVNKKGELCISSNQLTPGYWNNPGKTEESFFKKTLERTNYRFYRTGDSGYYDKDGDIMYIGRLDYQVKIQGYRIELSEIEFIASEYLQGKNTVAVTFENVVGNTEIALFVEGELTDESDLYDYFKLKIPYYMIPSKIISRENFPLNQNGKTDRNILKKLVQ
jgi:D-alanine--poly(phosphoribitol) ligase subunit 1